MKALDLLGLLGLRRRTNEEKRIADARKRGLRVKRARVPVRITIPDFRED